MRYVLRDGTIWIKLAGFHLNDGGNRMKILTDEAEDKLVSIIGTAIVLSIALLIIGLVGWVEVGM